MEEILIENETWDGPRSLRRPWRNLGLERLNGAVVASAETVHRDEIADRVRALSRRGLPC